MAEGGVPKSKSPPEPKGKPSPDWDPLKDVKDEDVNTLELLLARDLITYVMRRRIPSWDFEGRYGIPSAITPFSFRIRNAVEHYLVKEDINIYFLFARAFAGTPLNYHTFIVAMTFVVDSVYPSVQYPNDLLRLIALFAQYTMLAYKRGVHMAPYYALIAIQDVMYSYIKQKGCKSRDFHADLGKHAETLILETPLVPHESLM